MNTGNAIGIVETSSIAKGFEIADTVLKTARVELVVNRTICPGKYMILIGGHVDAVQSSIESGIRIGAHTVVDHFVIANLHPAVYPAISGVAHLFSLGPVRNGFNDGRAGFFCSFDRRPTGSEGSRLHRRW